MNTSEIRDIVELMGQSDLCELELEREGFRLRLARGMQTSVCTMAPAAPMMTQMPVMAAPAASATGSAGSAPAASAPGQLIRSPMVGTFYQASSPEGAPFVRAGSRVEADSVVCIIEAMKVMNEIQAEISGEILEVLVKNGQTVEYGQPLFRVKPV